MCALFSKRFYSAVESEKVSLVNTVIPVSSFPFMNLNTVIDKVRKLLVQVIIEFGVAT